MTSKEDDTLPLPVLSQELSVNFTADEDFIPTSQPQGSGCSKLSKNLDSNSSKTTGESGELRCSVSSFLSRIDDTLPREDVIVETTLDKDKSTDFIPDTEIKRTKINYAKEETSCKKKLSALESENLESNPLWETQSPKSPETTQQFSILQNSPTKTQSPNHETPIKCERFITEIIVNDSAETVDLEGSPVKAQGSKSMKENKIVEKPEFSCSTNSDVGRCEETQIFDNSSVLLLELPGPSSSLVIDQSEKSIKGVTLQKLYEEETIDNNELDLQEEVNILVSECSPPGVAETSRKFDAIEKVADLPKSKGNAFPEPEVELNVNGSEQYDSSVEIRKIEFKLIVNGLITFNAKTNKVLKKTILNVNEISKPRPKPDLVERFSDNATDKSKRYSTSSSGSVYSDKLGLPFALPKRVSIVSDQTDSSEDDFSMLLKEREIVGRTPWSNEYLLPLKLDELMQVSVEKQRLLNRPNMEAPLRKLKNRSSSKRALSVQSVRSSSSEQKSISNSVKELQSVTLKNSEEILEKITPERYESPHPEVNDTPKKNDGIVKNEVNSNEEGVQHDDEHEKQAPHPEEFNAVEPKLEPSVPSDGYNQVKAQTTSDSGNTCIALREGLPVLARWTDKRYYSGVLSGNDKSDRWCVKFDDGTSKMVREDFIMPAVWLKVGALVFTLIDDKYVSGQITEIKYGRDKVTYEVELDVKKRKVSARVSDLCLTDVMATIIREKYKPLVGTPRGKADIDFDNVLSGKRLREQRTPLRPPSTHQSKTSVGKKKSSKVKKDNGDGLETIKETPETSSGRRKIIGLKSESGHLVEDKSVSTDSPLVDEAGETPLRRTSKETRNRTKPRSLSYETEETRLGRSKAKNWLMADGTPTPGPSGVKFKRQKTKAKADEYDEPVVKRAYFGKSYSKGTRFSKKSLAGSNLPESTEKSRKKSKSDDSVEGNDRRKLIKKGDVQVKTKPRRG